MKKEERKQQRANRHGAAKARSGHTTGQQNQPEKAAPPKSRPRGLADPWLREQYEKYGPVTVEEFRECVYVLGVEHVRELIRLVTSSSLTPEEISRVALEKVDLRAARRRLKLYRRRQVAAERRQKGGA